jgi:hypothetical protein
MTATEVTAIFFYEKNYYEKTILNDFIEKSIYEKFLCSRKIGIGVILYEKGKGKFVGDWKTHHTEIMNN